MTKHTVSPIENPLAAGAMVCSECGAPIAKVNDLTAKIGWKHYQSTAAYKARVLAALR
jgi:hypothetical protein